MSNGATWCVYHNSAKHLLSLFLVGCCCCCPLDHLHLFMYMAYGWQDRTGVCVCVCVRDCVSNFEAPETVWPARSTVEWAQSAQSQAICAPFATSDRQLLLEIDNCKLMSRHAVRLNLCAQLYVSLLVLLCHPNQNVMSQTDTENMLLMRGWWLHSIKLV